LVDFAKSHQMSFQSMHLLDRIALAYLQTTITAEENNYRAVTEGETTAVTRSEQSVAPPNNGNINNAPHELSAKDPVKVILDEKTLIPLSVLLAMLNLLILTDNVGDRIKGLFYAASLLDHMSGVGNVVHHQKNDSSTSPVYPQTAAYIDNSSPSSIDQHASLLSRNSLESMLSALLVTDQIPPNKQITETGTKWPIKLHRRKDQRDMIDEVSYVGILCHGDGREAKSYECNICRLYAD